MHQNQRIFVSWSERTCRGDLAWSPVLFMAGGDIAPPLRAFLTLDELPEILMRLPCKVNLQVTLPCLKAGASERRLRLPSPYGVGRGATLSFTDASHPFCIKARL